MIQVLQIPINRTTFHLQHERIYHSCIQRNLPKTKEGVDMLYCLTSGATVTLEEAAAANTH